MVAYVLYIIKATLNQSLYNNSRRLASIPNKWNLIKTKKSQRVPLTSELRTSVSRRELLTLSRIKLSRSEAISSSRKALSSLKRERRYLMSFGKLNATSTKVSPITGD